MSLNDPAGEVTHLLRLNDQILSVASTGVALRLADDVEPTPALLHEINANIAIRASRGDQINVPTESGVALYGDSLKAFGSSDGSLTSLEPLYQLGKAQRERIRKIRYAQGHLLVIYLLAGFVFFTFTMAYARLLGFIYETSKLAPGPAYNFLNLLHNNLPWLIVGYVVVMLCILLWDRRIGRSRRNRVEPYHNSDKTLAEYATAAMLSDYQKYYPSSFAHPSQHDLLAQPNSPLLQWASSYQSASETSNSNHVAALMVVSQLSKNTLSLKTKIRGLSYPILGRIVPGALLVLFMGVVLFWPLVELLVTICLP
jgi:hypothetical protein